MRNKSFWIKTASILYIFLLIYLLFFAYFRQGTSTRVNIIPFKTIIGFFRDFYLPHWWYWAINIPGNIVAFIPLPFIFKSFFGTINKPSTKFIVALLIPVFIELLQWLFQVGSSNIDDVILNIFGLYIGFRLVSKREQNKAS